MKRISVVTPCLNSERYIEQTLRSVAMQRDDGVEVEHLVIDGGSADGTAALVAKYAHPHTHYISSRDGGPAEAINKGLCMASGDYLCWLNSDDVYAPHALVRAVEALEAHPEKAFCFGHCPIIDADGREFRRLITFFKEFWYPLSSRFVIRVLNYISQPAMVFRRSAFELAGPLRTDLHAAWDYDLTLRLWRHGGCVRVKRPAMACFRWTPHSISGRGYKRQFAEELACAVDDAGKWAFSSIVHRFVCWGIVFCYGLMSRGNRP